MSEIDEKERLKNIEEFCKNLPSQDVTEPGRVIGITGLYHEVSASPLAELPPLPDDKALLLDEKPSALKDDSID